VNDEVDGEIRKRKGMRAALANESAQWKSNYFRIAFIYFFEELKIGEELRFETINAKVRKEFGDPHVPQVFSAISGAIIRNLEKEGLIERVGTRKSSITSNNACDVAVYRRIA
jgi:hypothetical protein